MYFFLSNFSLQNYKIGPKKTQNYLPKLEIQTEQNLKKLLYIKVFDLESAKYCSVKNNVKNQKDQNCALLWK